MLYVSTSTSIWLTKVLTYLNCHTNISEEEFLLAFMSFAGRLTSPPSGLNPISNKKAIESFPQLSQ